MLSDVFMLCGYDHASPLRENVSLIFTESVGAVLNVTKFVQVDSVSQKMSHFVICCNFIMPTPICIEFGKKRTNSEL